MSKYNQEIDPFVEDLVLSFEKAYGNLMKALIAWEVAPREFVEKLDDHKAYPFTSSFDEVVYDIGAWVLELQQILNDHYKKQFNPTMTVGDLRKIIEGMDDNIQVVIGTNDWYSNIPTYNYPDGDSYSALTLNMGVDCDTRQF
jgi:hypothetical protein